jgi:hypothetical protein
MTHEHPCRGSFQDIAMSISEFQLRGVADPRLAIHATSPLPAWLFSLDGSRVLWANPPAARAFGAANAVALAARTFSPADLHRRQVLQLARRLAPNGMPRLERLRGFGAPLAGLVTCGCARMDFSDGSEAILVTATEAAGRTMATTCRSPYSPVTACSSAPAMRPASCSAFATSPRRDSNRPAMMPWPTVTSRCQSASAT